MSARAVFDIQLKAYHILGILYGLLCLSACAPVAATAPSPPSPPASGGDRGGAIYYVSPSGDDDHPGTQAYPWGTIQHAAEVLNAGDTVYIRAGTYPEQVIPRRSGSEGATITYAAYPGERPEIDGATLSLPEWGGLIQLFGVDYVRIVGLTVRNAGPHDNSAGILVDGCRHVSIEDNTTSNTTSSGIGVWNSAHVIVDGNEVELACNDGEQECITVAGTDYFRVCNNHVHHGGPGSKGGEGIDVKDGSSNGAVYGNHVHDLVRLGIYVDAWDKHTHDIDLYANVVHDVAADGFSLASEQGGLLERVRVFNNLAYNNKWVGLHLHDCCTNDRPIHDVQIVNNTFTNNGWDPWGGGILIANPDVTGLVVRNNIASGNLSFQIADEAGLPGEAWTVDHNLIDGYRGYPGETRGIAYVEGDPLFAALAKGDLHLRAGSPAIDAGSIQDAPGEDIDGQSRPQGARIDIGADEVLIPTAFAYLPLAINGP